MPQSSEAMVSPQPSTHRRKWRFAVAGGIALLSMVTMGLSASAKTIQPFGVSGSWDTSWSYNPYAVNYAMVAQPLWVLLPLAFQEDPSGKWDPQLAKSWKFEGNKFIITLQPNAKWQNGHPVTSTDVVDSFLLGMSAGWGWSNLANEVTALNGHQVAFTLRSMTRSTPVEPVTHRAVLATIMGNYVVPAATYGRLITAKFRSEVDTWLSSVNPNSPAAKKAGTYIGVYDKTLMAFNPNQLLADGPFELQSMTTDQASLVKNPDFYGAPNVHVDQVLMWQGAGSPEVETEMFANKLAWPLDYVTQGVIHRWEATSFHHYTVEDTTQGESFYFNDHVYPFNQLKVRQAILYAVNRGNVSEAGEGFHVNTYSTFPTGLSAPQRRQWLGSNATLLKEGFNPYSYDPAKARQLLRSAGFTDRRGTWYTAKGLPFTIAVTAPAGWASTILNASNLTSQLDAFGIKATATSVEQPGYWSDLIDGSFDLAWGWDGFGAVNPLQSLDTLLVGQNYVPGSTKGSYVTRGMGFGPNVTVPGLGSVNLANSLSAYVNLGKSQKISQITRDYAKMINADVPILPFDTKNNELFWSTEYWNWPSLSHKTLWETSGNEPQFTPVLMIEAGLIRPK